MLSVYICEDDKFQLDYITECIEKCIFINDYDMKIAGSFTTPSECISIIEKERPVHAIYFLDIDLKSDMNGIRLAEKIRSFDPRAFIIFITTHEEMLMVTFKYKVEALDFIIKDESLNLSDRIDECFLNVLDKQTYISPAKTDKLTFHSNRKKYYIEKNNIYYFNTSNDHKVAVHHTGGILEISGTIIEILNSLDSNFYQCYRGYIVNLHHILTIDDRKGMLILDNSASCPCSKINIPIIKRLIENERG